MTETQLSLFDEVTGQAPGATRTEIELTEAKAVTDKKAVSIPQPPLNAEFILHLLLQRDEQDTLIGDLLERYVEKHKRLGKGRADIWFCVEVARSLWPLAKRSAAKAIRVAVLGEWIRRMIQ